MYSEPTLRVYAARRAGQYLAQGHGLLAAEATDVEGTVQIPDGQVVGLDVEVAVVWNWHARLNP